jgi:hypothetical protein
MGNELQMKNNPQGEHQRLFCFGRNRDAEGTAPQNHARTDLPPISGRPRRYQSEAIGY